MRLPPDVARHAKRSERRLIRELNMRPDYARLHAEYVARGFLESKRPATLDDDLWAKFAKDFGLPDAARKDLVELVSLERLIHSATLVKSPFKQPPPAEVRRELERLCKYARALAHGVGAMDGSIFGAWDLIRRRRGDEIRIQDWNDMGEFLQTSIATVARLADLLESAREYERSRSETERTRKPASVLREVVGALDQYLFHHTGTGLVRASEDSKGRGLAAARKDFTSIMLKHILGEDICREISEATIDDAMKDVIYWRRHVGRSR